MKAKHFFLFFFLLCPFAILKAQVQDKWTLYVGCKKIAEGTPDAPGNAAISSVTKKSIVIKYSGEGSATSSKRSILIFDTDRHELWRRESSRNYSKFKFQTALLREKTHGKPFEIYTVAIPADPEEAALVRVRPVLLCTVNWERNK